MRPMDDRGSYNHGPARDTFESHRGNGTTRGSKHHKVLAPRTKPTPSKWDDAQKWLVGLAGQGDNGHTKSKPRNSNADDLRLLHSVSQNGRSSCSSLGGGLEDVVLGIGIQEIGETKKIDCHESFKRINHPVADSPLTIKSVCVRDAGTEMTPAASQEPSRNTTPIRATTPALTSPISSRPPSPIRCHHGGQHIESNQTGARTLENNNESIPSEATSGNGLPTGREGDVDGHNIIKASGTDNIKNCNSLDARAMAWDEAERAKYVARYKREEMKILAWENHEKRKAELEMKRMEAKAERQKSQAQERMQNKLATIKRMAEEKRANAEAELSEQAAKAAEKAEYIRRTGHMPSSFFSFKLPCCG